MGFYINLPEAKNKADQLVKLYGAEKLPKAPPSFFTVEGKALICVVENPHFDAAAYCYSQGEFDAFTYVETPEDIKRHRREAEAMGAEYLHLGEPGPRPTTWLLMDKKLVEDLTGYRTALERRSREG